MREQVRGGRCTEVMYRCDAAGHRFSGRGRGHERNISDREMAFHSRAVRLIVVIDQL